MGNVRYNQLGPLRPSTLHERSWLIRMKNWETKSDWLLQLSCNLHLESSRVLTLNQNSQPAEAGQGASYFLSLPSPLHRPHPLYDVHHVELSKYGLRITLDQTWHGQSNPHLCFNTCTMNRMWNLKLAIMHSLQSLLIFQHNPPEMNHCYRNINKAQSK